MLKLFSFLLLVTALTVVNGQTSSNTMTVRFGGITYNAAPFIFDNPGDLYNYAHSQANTGKDDPHKAGPLHFGIEEEETAVIAFVRTNQGVSLSLIFDKPGNRLSGARAKIEVKCFLDGNDVTDTDCKRIFTETEVLCDDGSECNYQGLNSDGYMGVGPWTWAPGYTDGMITDLFPSGCIELRFKVLNVATSNYPNADHLKYLRVASRSFTEPHTPVILSPVGTINKTVTVNFCAYPAPVNCNTGKAWSRGDPHFRSMDGVRFDYQGRGTHLFCAALNDAVVIHACHQDRYPGSRAATNRAVTVLIGGREKIFFGVTKQGAFGIFLHKSSGGVEDLTNKGTDKSIVLEAGRVFGTFQGASSRITILHSDGWRLLLRGRVGRTMLVDILSFTGPTTENPGTEGLCGNFNCDDSDDFVMPNGTVTSQINEFGASWQMTSSQSLFMKFPDYATWGTDTCPSNDPNPAPAPSPNPIDCATTTDANEAQACQCCQQSCGGAPGDCDLQDYEDCLFDAVAGLEAGDDLSEVCGNIETPTCSRCTEPQICGDNGQCECPGGIGTLLNGCQPEECVPDTPGISRGDPHFRTIDGLRYDFQGRGLYTFCKADEVEVQTCQVDRSPGAWASINGAIAMRMGSTTFQLGKIGGVGDFVAMINGEVKTFSSAAQTLSSGALIYLKNNIYEVRYEGHRLIAKVRANRVIDAKFFPAPGSASSGLCGSNDCDRTNDFMLRNTNSIVSSPDDFGNSYKVAISGSSNLLAGTGFQCTPGNVPPDLPDPPAGGGNPADCAETPTDPVCSCCASKGFTETQDYDDCLFDVYQIYTTAEALEQGSGAAAVNTACSEEIEPPCPENCAGDCSETPGVCTCPGGGTPPSCAEPPGCVARVLKYVPGQGSYTAQTGDDGCACLEFE